MLTAGDSGVLVGRHDYALDPKKRLTIPSEWRGVMGPVMYAMPDRKERCLNLYPKAEMDVMLEKLRQKALLDPALSLCSPHFAHSIAHLVAFSPRERFAERCTHLSFRNDVRVRDMSPGRVRMPLISRR